MTDYIKIDWADVRHDDVLKHESGDRVTVKAVQPGTHRDVYVLGQWRSVASLEVEGFTPHRKVDQLPTKPGAYHDRDGDYWLLDRAGNWYDWSSLREPNPNGGRPDAYGPFTRLVPMPTHEQVEQVLVNEGCTMHFSGSLAVMDLLAGESDE